MKKNNPEKIPVTWEGMQLLYTKTGLLCVLLLKTYTREKGFWGASPLRCWHDLTILSPPLSEKRSHATEPEPKLERCFKHFDALILASNQGLLINSGESKPERSGAPFR